MHHSNPLFKDHTASHVRFDSRFVSHIKSSHKLEYGDFNGEVEWTDDSNGTKRPSETLSKLTRMVTWVAESSS